MTSPAPSSVERDVIAVTGATGHVGNVLVRELAARGTRVRGLIPYGEDATPLAGVDVEMITADPSARQESIMLFRLPEMLLLGWL